MTEQNAGNIKCTLRIKHTMFNSGRQSLVILHTDSPAVRELGLESLSHIKLAANGQLTYAEVMLVEDSAIVAPEEIILSERTQKFLQMLHHDTEAKQVEVSMADAINSFSHVRGKLFGKAYTNQGLLEIMTDITQGKYPDAFMATYAATTVGDNMNKDEVAALTDAMVKVGKKLEWDSDLVVDKHCIGGVAGNRTTPIVIAIIAAYGLMIPKTSSRAITSPAGTADTMEVLTNVDLDFNDIQRIVKQEKGCIVWGGSSDLSPADDIIIGVARALDIDGEGKMIASVVSKKIAAGSTHVLIDIPVGPNAKARTQEDAEKLKEVFEYVGQKLGITLKVMLSDGRQPVGRGIGPALEARDIVAVLKNELDAPQDLRKKSLLMAGTILEMSGKVAAGEGLKTATEILDSGKAWEKMQAIFRAQGAIKEIPTAKYTAEMKSTVNGTVQEINNRKICQAAKLAGAPEVKAAGMELLVHLGDIVKTGDVLYRLHADTEAALNTAQAFLKQFQIIEIA